MKKVTLIGETEQTVTENVNGRAYPRYFSLVTEKHDYLEGDYAGKSYRVVTRYVSTKSGSRGQCLGSSSAPWS